MTVEVFAGWVAVGVGMSMAISGKIPAAIVCILVAIVCFTWGIL